MWDNRSISAPWRSAFAWTLLRGVAFVILAGIGIGLAIALFATRVIASLLYGVGPIDVATYVTVASLLLGLALSACWVAARRALAVQPLEALRSD